MNDWTSFKRIEAVFNKEIPDRVPKYEGSIEIKDLNPTADGQRSGSAILFFSPEIIASFHGNPAFLSSLESLITDPRSLRRFTGGSVKKRTRLHKQFNYDMFLTEPGVPMVFNKILFKDFHCEENNRVVRDSNERLIWRTSPDGAHTRHGFMQNIEDWDKYMDFNADHPANWTLVQSTMKECRKLDIVPVFLAYGCAFFEELCGIFGFEMLFRLLIKHKDFIHKIVQQMSDFSIKVGERIIEEGGEYLYMTNDIGLKEKSMISPKMFNEFFKQGIKKFCEKIHKAGGKILMHSCGYVMEMLPHFIECGIDALHPIEQAAGNDIVEIKEKYGNDLVIVGNVPIPLLTQGTPQETRHYVKFLLKNISKNGGHIISSSHSITQWCKLENFLAYHDALADHGTYPIDFLM